MVEYINKQFKDIKGDENMTILVTGGAGYIGSHTCIELINEGYDVVVIDNLVNSHKEVIEKIEFITQKKIYFYEAGLENKKMLESIFQKHDIKVVIHFASLKSISESVEKPLEYYSNNLIGFIVLCDVMKRNNVKRLIFSSSATVYGNPHVVPIKENFPTSTTNPYGNTKLIIEDILHDLYKSDKSWSIALLRYFNPTGAHFSGLIGEDPNGMPNNLIPYIAKVAIGQLEYLNVFGSDYPTKDGTGVRDYIHVIDLSRGHVKAIHKIINSTGIDTYNLGTGKGYSVLEIIKAFEKVCGKKIKYKITDRRKGDIAVCYADINKAREELKWEAKMNLEEMCRDTWNFTKKSHEK